MRTYVMTTGALFGLLVVLHVWRLVEEGVQLVRDPWWVLITAAAAVLCLWALRVLRGSARP